MTLPGGERRPAAPGRRNSAHIGTVAAAYASTLLDVACRRGANREYLLGRTRIRDADLAALSTRVPIGDLLDLFEAGRELSGDPLLGLHMGAEAKPRTFGALGYAAMGAATLAQAVALIPRYEQVVYDGGRTSVARRGSSVEVVWHSGLDSAGSERVRPLNEAIVAGWLGFGRFIAASRFPAEQVRFQHPRPSSVAELDGYDAFFGCPVRFEAVDNALSVPASLLEVPLLYHDDALRQVMERHATAAIRDLEEGRRFTRRVAAAIRDRLASGAPTAAAVGRQLGTSERSLRRQLSAEGQSYHGLLSEVRLELASCYLADPTLTLLDVALLVGYSDQSAFSTAFRRWTGRSPSSLRAPRPARGRDDDHA
ncbi:MAG: AraC family transcriptional regulator [Deltaproteobacteria bacterium]|nr:AraC family transcriptional regulator [Deltaproteobacteria bacterium]